MTKLLGPVALAAVLVLATVARAETLAPAAPEEVGLSSARLARIQQVLQRDIDAGKLPGAVVALARRGRLVYFESFGVRAPGAGDPMPKDAIFRIYSMTKPLVSVAAMVLIEQGDMQLADPVAKHLPEFAEQMVSEPKADQFGRVSYTLVPAARPMTVQDLLRHTSGLIYGGLSSNAPVKDAYREAGLYDPDAAGRAIYRELDPAVEVARLAAAPLSHQPGTVWEYSLATDLLGRVVEAVSGMRLADFLEERLFAPLGMADTGFYVPAEKLARVAEPFAVDPASGETIPLLDVAVVPANDSGGAGGVSTAIDYLRFAQMLLDGGVLDGARILSRTTVALMASDHLGPEVETPLGPGPLLLRTPGYGFGLGFAVRRQAGIAAVPGSAGEFMWAGYAGTYFWIDPGEQLVGVMMTQAPGPSRAGYRRLIKQLTYQAIVD